MLAGYFAFSSFPSELRLRLTSSGTALASDVNAEKVKYGGDLPSAVSGRSVSQSQRWRMLRTLCEPSDMIDS